MVFSFANQEWKTHIIAMEPSRIIIAITPIAIVPFKHSKLHSMLHIKCLLYPAYNMQHVSQRRALLGLTGTDRSAVQVVR